MTKSQEREWEYKGAITAFLSLLFILMLSIVGAMLESASIQITRNRKRADVNLALECAFAEYHRELLEEYEVFARFGCDEETLVNRLEYYGATNMTHALVKRELLTDGEGAVFYEQAVRYMKDWLGIEHGVANSKLEFDMDSLIDIESAEVSERLNTMLEGEQAELPTENNPLLTVANLKNKGLLTLVVPDGETLSERSVVLEELPSHRAVEKGNCDSQPKDNAGDKVFFVAYLREHFADKTSEETPVGLLYETEYLLNGGASDKENLEAVCKQILWIRMGTNYAYLLTDTGRQSEAEALAATLCALLKTPGITQVVKHALLLAWAYGESIIDVRALLGNKKISVIKTDETWQLQLSNLAKIGTSEDSIQEKETQDGLSYQEYLIGLLLMAQKEELCMRSLDLIEGRLGIQTDRCVTKVEIQSKFQHSRGVRDTFVTRFQYQ